MTDSVGDDLLRGAKQISHFTGEPVRRVFHLAESGLIPAFKIGATWCLRKSTYLAHLKQLETAGKPGKAA